jgi:hypothetical protein
MIKHGSMSSLLTTSRSGTSVSLKGEELQNAACPSVTRRAASPTHTASTATSLAVRWRNRASRVVRQATHVSGFIREAAQGTHRDL